MLRVFHYIIVFALLLCGFNHISLASDQQEDTIQQTLLPFDSFEREVWVVSQIEEYEAEIMLPDYWVDESGAEYRLDENSLLFDFIKKKILSK